jgi:ankyrin repeat protein
MKAFFESCFSSVKAPKEATSSTTIVSTTNIAKETKPLQTSVPVVIDVKPALSSTFVELKEHKTQIHENKLSISCVSEVMTREANIFVASLRKARLDYIQQLLDSNPELISGHYSTTNKVGVKFGPYSVMSFLVRFNEPSDEVDEALTLIAGRGGFDYDKNPDGTNCLNVAVKQGKKELIETIIQLKEAILEVQDLTLEQRAIAVKEYINNHDNAGMTVLHHITASMNSQETDFQLYDEIMIYMLQNGADLYIRDKTGNEPLSYLSSKTDQVTLGPKYRQIFESYNLAFSGREL